MVHIIRFGSGLPSLSRGTSGVFRKADPGCKSASLDLPKLKSRVLIHSSLIALCKSWVLRLVIGISKVPSRNGLRDLAKSLKSIPSQAGKGPEYAGSPSGKASEKVGSMKAESILKEVARSIKIRWEDDGKKQEAKCCAVPHAYHIRYLLCHS